MPSQISAVVTYHARCARSLLNILPHSLQRGHTEPSSPNPILLFALAPSLTTPPEVLFGITSFLSQFYPNHVGCISAPLPHQYLNQGTHGSGPHSCSLAYALVNGVAFRSTISGRAQSRVGRWHAAQHGTEDVYGAMRVNMNDSKVNWEDVWDRTARPVGQDSETLPDALRNLNPSAIHDIVYFSDKAPEGLARVLDGAFPHANKVSLIASSTPFITGHPVTLFHNGSICSSGAVGIVFSSSPSPSSVVEVSFPPLVTLSTDLNVTRSQGNLILSLDSRNPTQLLLGAIQKHDLASLQTTWTSKEDEYYVGVLDSSRQISQLHRINAGDPSRGAIALDADSAPKEGSIVRLYHLPTSPDSHDQGYIPDTISNNISLSVVSEVMQSANSGNVIADDGAADADYAVVPNAFLAASENGFTLTRGVQGVWKCAVPGSRLGLSWNRPTSI